MTQLKQIYQENKDVLLLKLELNQGSQMEHTIINQVHNIIQKKSQFTNKVKNIHSDTEEDKEHWKTIQQPQIV